MKKSIKDPWCPLTGDIGPHDNLILRARALWGVRSVVKDNIIHAYRPNKAVIEKARKIYNRWDEYNHDPLRIEILELNLSMAVDPGRREEARDESLKDIMMLFYEKDDSGKHVFIDVSEQEVFSVLAIYEARVSKTPAWPDKLLAIAKEYSPDALLGKDRRVQVKNWGLRRWIDTNSDSEKAEWLKMGNEYRKKHPDKKLHSPRRLAKDICAKLNLPEKSFQTVYKHLLKNNV